MSKIWELTTTMETTTESGPGKIPEPKLTGINRPPKNRWNRIVLLVAAAIVLNAMLDLTGMAGIGGKTLAVGEKMPEFSLETIDGGKVSLQDFIGKKTVYFFFADWCPCSHFSADFINKIRSEHESDNLRVFGVGIQDKPENIKSFAAKHEFAFPVAPDGAGLASLAGVSTTPTTIFTNINGIVTGVYVGKIERFEQIEKQLADLLESEREPGKEIR